VHLVGFYSLLSKHKVDFTAGPDIGRCTVQQSVTVEQSAHRQDLSDTKPATKDHTADPQEKD
jgi:hypothetical protein